MAILAIQQPVEASVALADAAAAGGGDSFQNSGRELLVVRNSDASDHTVTIDSPGTCDFNVAANAAHDVAAVNVVAGTTRVFGPFSPKKYNDANGRVQVTYSAATGMKVSVIGTPQVNV